MIRNMAPADGGIPLDDQEDAARDLAEEVRPETVAAVRGPQEPPADSILDLARDLRREADFIHDFAPQRSLLLRVAGQLEAIRAAPIEDDRDDPTFADWTPEFTVWLVRDGQSWPMRVDTVWLSEDDANKRAAVRGANWWAMKYSHIQPPAAPLVAPAGVPEPDRTKKGKR